jgi:hypothetical protein
MIFFVWPVCASHAAANAFAKGARPKIEHTRSEGTNSAILSAAFLIPESRNELSTVVPCFSLGEKRKTGIAPRWDVPDITTK